MLGTAPARGGRPASALFALAFVGLGSTIHAGTSATSWWVEGWCAPYVYSEWGAPACLFYDTVRGEMFMTDAKRQRVMVFDKRGVQRYQFARTYVDPRTGNPAAGEPHDLVVNAAGLIYMTDFLGADVTIHNFRGEQIGEFDIRAALGAPEGRVRAENLALGPDGTIWVSTSGDLAGVIGFDDRDRVVARIGYGGEGYESIGEPTALAVDARGDLWVADRRGFPVIRHYGPDGRFKGGFGGRDVAKKDFSLASAILCADDGTLWIADALRQVVKHFTVDGEFIEWIGGFGFNPGELRYPSGLAGNGVTEVYVCERVGRRIQKYIPEELVKSKGAGNGS